MCMCLLFYFPVSIHQFWRRVCNFLFGQYIVGLLEEKKHHILLAYLFGVIFFLLQYGIDIIYILRHNPPSKFVEIIRSIQLLGMS